MSEARPPPGGLGKSLRSGFTARAPGKRRISQGASFVALGAGGESLGFDSSSSACNSDEEQSVVCEGKRAPRSGHGSKRQRLAPLLTCVLCGEAGKDVTALPEDARSKLEALAASYDSLCQMCAPPGVIVLKDAASRGLDAVQADGAAKLGRHQRPFAGGGCKGWKQMANKVNHSGSCICLGETKGGSAGGGSAGSATFTGGALTAHGPDAARVAPTFPRGLLIARPLTSPLPRRHPCHPT